MKKRDDPVILIVAGGSGGHVYPALALVDELSQRKISAHIATDERGYVYMSSQQLKQSVHLIQGSHTHRNKWLRTLKKLVYGLRAGIQAVRLLHQLKPDAVIGFGGFATFPVLLAALVMGYPYMLHEQNAILGKVNRLFARFARRIAVSYKNTERLSEKYKDKTIETGMPTRPALASVPVDYPYHLPAGDEKLTLFIFGGSQGAQCFDETLPQAMALMPAEKRACIHIIQQCRNDLCKELKDNYANLGITAELAPFFNPMTSCYGRAHLVLCRAGASSIAELKVTGRPAILVPYPWAADHHQDVNAHEIETHFAGWVLSQEHFTPQRLLNILLSLLEHPQTLLYAAQSMQCLATLKAHMLLANVVEKMACEESRYGLMKKAQS